MIMTLFINIVSSWLLSQFWFVWVCVCVCVFFLFHSIELSNGWTRTTHLAFLSFSHQTYIASVLINIIQKWRKTEQETRKEELPSGIFGKINKFLK